MFVLQILELPKHYIRACFNPRKTIVGNLLNFIMCCVRETPVRPLMA